MSAREPAGWERAGGKSAELSVQAWPGGGIGRNTSGTVRGRKSAGALSANRELRAFRM